MSRVMIEQHVCSADLNPADVRCPECRGNTLTMFGNVQVPRTAVMENGQVTSAEIKKDEQVFELEHLECPACNIRFIIKPREVVYLEKELFKLAALYEEATGHNPLVQGAVC